jgi:futalosine hydrolase
LILVVAATDRELCGHDGLVCGVGPVEAAAATARALALHPVQALLHVGLAGAHGLPPGSLVVGTEAVYCDLSAEWPVVERVGADPALVAAVAAVVPSSSRMPIHTSAAVGGTRGSASGGAFVEAMEGFGVLRSAELAGVPAVEVRAISNAIGEDDRARWDLAAGLSALETALPPLLTALRDAAPARSS